MWGLVEHIPFVLFSSVASFDSLLCVQHIALSSRHASRYKTRGLSRECFLHPLDFVPPWNEPTENIWKGEVHWNNCSNQTNQIISCQLGQLAKARGFLFVRWTRLDGRCYRLPNHGLAKFLPKPVCRKAITSYTSGKAFSAVFFILLLLPLTLQQHPC